MSVDADDGDPAQSLNAIYNIPTSPYDDKFVVGKVGIADIPMEYKQHIGKNISVPDEADGNNLIGQILGIRTLDLKDLGEYFFYEMLFQANEENSQAVVKLICTKKYKIKVLGVETEDEIMRRINEAKTAHQDNQDSIQMQILQKLAEERNRPKSRRRIFGRQKKQPSVAVNLIKEALGNDYAVSMRQPGKSSIPNDLDFARPSSLSRTSSKSSSRSSSPKSRAGSPGRLRRDPSFRRKTTAGKKTKKAKKTKKVKKMQKRKKTKRR